VPMDDELRQFLERMHQETTTAISGTREHSEEMAAQTRRHSDEVAAETRRHFDVVAERMDAKIETIAEGVVHCNERLDRLDAKVDRLSTDMANEFNDVRSMIRFSHHELDRRVRSLEETLADLQSRVERLEGSTH
jgi:uncharacterized protein YceH (UPF0502 family)